MHGYAAGNAFWMFVLKGLSQHFRVACVEMFGCGRSERLPFKAKDVVQTVSKYIKKYILWRCFFFIFCYFSILWRWFFLFFGVLFFFHFLSFVFFSFFGLAKTHKAQFKSLLRCTPLKMEIQSLTTPITLPRRDFNGIDPLLL